MYYFIVNLYPKLKEIEVHHQHPHHHHHHHRLPYKGDTLVLLSRQKVNIVNAKNNLHIYLILFRLKVRFNLLGRWRWGWRRWCFGWCGRFLRSRLLWCQFLGNFSDVSDSLGCFLHRWFRRGWFWFICSYRLARFCECHSQ